MDQNVEKMGMLDLMVRPGFCVQNNQIVKANHAALGYQIPIGADVRPFFLTGSREYAEFQGGCLYLTLQINEQNFGVSVTRMDGFDVFIFEDDEDRSQLQAMALAARELREPLASVMVTADRLFPIEALQDDPQTREQVARINRGLLQMLRVISNMSDANQYVSQTVSRQDTLDITAFLEEIFRHAEDLIAHSEVQLTFRNLPDPLYCLVDTEKLERAVLNILSNAVKFTPKGGQILASLIRRNHMLYLQIQDSGSGIAENLRGSLHSRYLRQPVIEDGRFGIGLGMVIIRSAASCHGGTVLIDQPEGTGTRVTLTLAIRQNTDSTVRSPLLRVDYAGERDHGLLELADALPASLYE